MLIKWHFERASYLLIYIIVSLQNDIWKILKNAQLLNLAPEYNSWINQFTIGLILDGLHPVVWLGRGSAKRVHHHVCGAIVGVSIAACRWGVISAQRRGRTISTHTCSRAAYVAKRFSGWQCAWQRVWVGDFGRNRAVFIRG